MVLCVFAATCTLQVSPSSPNYGMLILGDIYLYTSSITTAPRETLTFTASSASYFSFLGTNLFYPAASCNDGSSSSSCWVSSDAGPPVLKVAYPCEGGRTSLDSVMVVASPGSEGSFTNFKLELMTPTGAIDRPVAYFYGTAQYYYISTAGAHRLDSL